MAYQVFARKYRPQSFDEVLGQEAIVRTLQNAINLDRLHHAYLFCGARGVGKTSLARIFAKSLNCANGPTLKPCQTCTSCQNITKGISLDVFEIDGASNTGIDNIRELREQARYLPTEGKYKIYIIDEVHMLSESAFNGLLKTMEEPPPHLIFIMATTEPHDIPATILSRCQRFDCTRFTLPQLEGHLKKILDQEKVALPPESLRLIASSADGSVRDALSLLDQVVSFCGQDANEDKVAQLLGYADKGLSHDLFLGILQKDLNAVLGVCKTLYEKGSDLKVFGESVLRLIRDTLVMSQGGVLDTSPSDVEKIKQYVTLTESSHLLFLFQILLKVVEDLSRSEFPQLILEVGLVKMIQAGDYLSLSQLVASLDNESIGNTQGVRSPVPPSYKPAPLAQKAQPASKASMAFEGAYQSVKADGIVASNQGSHGLAAGRNTSDWFAFVEEIKNAKPQFGSLIEQGHPIEFNSKNIVLGYALGSIHLEMMRDRQDTLKHYVESWFGHGVPVELKSVSSQDKAPPTAAIVREKKEQEKKDDLRAQALSNPSIQKVQEILGATLVDVKEVK